MSEAKLHDADHVVSRDGTVVVKDLEPGVQVNVTVTSRRKRTDPGQYQGALIRHDRPFDSVFESDEWDQSDWRPGP